MGWPKGVPRPAETRAKMIAGQARPDVKARVVAANQRRKTDPVERFWSKVKKTRGCWLWTGGVTGFGYGSFSVTDRIRRPAHRWAFILTYGEEAADGLDIHHLCRNKVCVKPKHMRAMTRGEHKSLHIEEGW